MSVNETPPSPEAAHGTAEPGQPRCRPGLCAEPVRRLRHFGFEATTVGVELVAGVCPRCGDIVATLESEEVTLYGTEQDDIGWHSLTVALAETREHGLAHRAVP